MWINFCLNDAIQENARGNIAITTDLRFVTELNALIKAGNFTTVRIHISEEDRRERYERLYGPLTNDRKYHVSEVQLDSFTGWDLELTTNNTSSIEERWAFPIASLITSLTGVSNVVS